VADYVCKMPDACEAVLASLDEVSRGPHP